MQRAYYFDNIEKFCKESIDDILGKITRNNEFTLEIKQRNTWIYEISLLQDCFKKYLKGGIAFEFIIPRIGNRIDTVFIFRGIIYLIEFKVGETNYPSHAIEQVLDYSLDLKYFHKESHNKKIVPILICTEAPYCMNEITVDEDGIYKVIKVNKKSLQSEIDKLTKSIYDNDFSLTHKEISELLSDEQLAVAQAWYNNVQVGNSTLYNIYSVMSYLYYGILENYWTMSGTAKIMAQLITEKRLSDINMY